jgi:hypothetical protein
VIVADYSDYDNQTRELIAGSNPGCAAALSRAYANLTAVVGSAEVKREFGFGGDANETSVLFVVAEAVARRIGEGKVATFCDRFNGERESLRVRFLEVLKDEGVNADALNPLGWNATDATNETADRRTQFWLQCTEFGWFHTAGGMRPGAIGIDYFDGVCRTLFGRGIGAVERNNAVLGGRRPASSGVFFVEPESDLWAGVFAQSDNGTVGNRVISINDTHVFDLNNMSKLETKEANVTREIELVYARPGQCTGRRVNGRCKCNTSATGDNCSRGVTGLDSFETVAITSVFVTTALLLVIGGSVWYWGRRDDDEAPVGAQVYT